MRPYRAARWQTAAPVRALPRSFRGRLALITLVGVAVRLLYVWVLAPDTKGFGDWFWFHQQANDLSDGRFFVDPFLLREEGREVATAFHPPLWPLVLSVPSRLGLDGFLEHRSTGCLLAGGTIFLVGLLGRRVAGTSVGLVAAGLFAAYPSMIAADGGLMSESLYGLLVAALLLAAYRLLDRPSARSALLLGAAIGAAALARGEALLFLPLLALPVVWRAGSDRLRNLALVCLAAVAVLAPWSVRSLVIFDRPVAVSTNAPAAMAGANCPEAYRGQDIGYWHPHCISQRRSDNEAREGQRWLKEALGYERDHVSELPRVAGARLLRTWSLYQPRRMTRFAEGRHYRAEEAGTVVYYLLLVLAVAGVVALRRRRQPLLILLAPALLVTLVSVFWYGIPRFRHSFEIPIVVLAAVALDDLVRRARARRAPGQQEQAVQGTAASA
jgi:hypothetical protein